MNYHLISEETIDLNLLSEILKSDKKLKLSEDAILKINKCRNYLDQKALNSNAPVYGINTGFGSLHNIKIEAQDLEKLQRNLVISHACGMGDIVPNEIVRIMLFTKIQSLSYGNSGIQLSTVNRLIDFYNSGIYPKVYTKGSLGASGDLSPLAHLSLPLLGEGELFFEGEFHPAKKVLSTQNWEVLHLKSKEGLALLNGTQFMLGYALFALLKSKKLMDWSTKISAISLDAFDCRMDPFHPSIHALRPHKGQVNVAKDILKQLEDSEISKSEKVQVQDPYSFRCIPQVHGATRDTIDYVEKVFLTELNSVTDNPNVFPDEDLIVSGGNFHGQPLALALDFLAIAIAELASISERRIYNLISGQRELPAFLVAKPGLNSGFMIPQYTAASMVSENKQLCTPASVDSIVSSNGQEDHVSMGANSAIKMYRVIENSENVLAIELLNAAQALEFRRPKKSSPKNEILLSSFRKEIKFIEEDVIMHQQMQKAKKFIVEN